MPTRPRKQGPRLRPTPESRRGGAARLRGGAQADVLGGGPGRADGGVGVGVGVGGGNANEGPPGPDTAAAGVAASVPPAAQGNAVADARAAREPAAPRRGDGVGAPPVAVLKQDEVLQRRWARLLEGPVRPLRGLVHLGPAAVLAPPVIHAGEGRTRAGRAPSTLGPG